MYTTTKQFTLRALHHAAVAIALVVGLGACSADADSLVSDTDSAPYLVLNDVTLGSTISPIRSETRADDPLKKVRPVTSIPANAVVKMEYSYGETGDPKTAYAKNIAPNWKIYEEIACTKDKELKIRPDAAANESWESMKIKFSYHPEEDVNGAYSTEAETIVGDNTYHYDQLHATATTATTSTLGSSIAPNGKVRAQLLHAGAQLKLQTSDISVSDYADGYNGISAIKINGTHSFTKTTSGSWYGIVPAATEITSFDITLANSGDESKSATITVAHSFTPKANTSYALKLILTPDKAAVDIEALGGWGDDVPTVNEVFIGTAEELGKVDLAVKKKYKFWTITDAGDVLAAIKTELEALYIVDKTARISLTIPNCTAVGTAAFANCAALASVSLPAATAVGGSAFSGCRALTTLTFNAPIETWGKSVFTGLNAEQIAKITLTLAADQKQMDKQADNTWTATTTPFNFSASNKTFCGYTFAAINESTTTK